ncbi:MAG: hypothetical protein KC766_22945 [Myxococcales bacterium]|nr:hypothetical protein [Myxococcales bacterium]
MCLFTKAVSHVSSTHIFARREGARQLLVYSMEFAATEELAMVLPLPVPPGSDEDAVDFIDLGGYAEFFADLREAFPLLYSAAQSSGPAPRGGGDLAVPLKVIGVGRFEASFVPSMGDFSRLDPRFQLPGDVTQKLARYADWGFAVFKLKPKPKKLGLFEPAPERIHPMAFSFPHRHPDQVFFPTLHVHDGQLTERANFDHLLIVQPPAALASQLDWFASDRILGEVIDEGRAPGVVDGAAKAQQLSLFGPQQNRDVVLALPRGTTPESLRLEHELFTLQARVGALLNPAHVAYHPRWEQSAERMAELLPRLAAAFEAFLSPRSEALALCGRVAELPRYFMNGRLLFSGTSYLDGSPGASGDAGVVRFQPFSDGIEPQHLYLGFTRVPEQDALNRLVQELNQVVTSVVS